MRVAWSKTDLERGNLFLLPIFYLGVHGRNRRRVGVVA